MLWLLSQMTVLTEDISLTKFSNLMAVHVLSSWRHPQRSHFHSKIANERRFTLKIKDGIIHRIVSKNCSPLLLLLGLLPRLRVSRYMMGDTPKFLSLPFRLPDANSRRFRAVPFRIDGSGENHALEPTLGPLLSFR